MSNLPRVSDTILLGGAVKSSGFVAGAATGVLAATAGADEVTVVVVVAVWADAATVPNSTAVPARIVFTDIVTSIKMQAG